MMQGNPAFGWDFAVFWSIGRAVLDGGNPYAVWGSWYPPATSVLFSVLALLNPATMFVVWSAINILLLSAISGRRPARWILFSPVFFVVAAGQIDLFFLWLMTLMRKGGWTAASAGALITLKPQIAAILLPWWIVHWLRHDRRMVARFAAASTVLHTLPLLYDPTIYAKWYEQIMIIASARSGDAPTFMGLTSFGLPTWATIGLSISVLTAAILLTNERTTRIAAALANPAIMMYDFSVLVNTAPWWLMVPVSWLAWPIAYYLHSFVPFIIMPLAAIIYQLTLQKTALLGTIQVGHAENPTANLMEAT